MKENRVLYEELRPAEFVERVNAFPVAYLPLGTLEWHGLHLPLGSDGLQSRGVFERIAADVGGVVLPMLFLGPDNVVEGNASDRERANLNAVDGVPPKDRKPVFIGMDQHSFEKDAPQQLEGSAYHVEEALFNALLDSVLWNLARAGFRVVVGHGHGPSTGVFDKGKERFKEQFGLQTYTLRELGEKGAEGIQTDHAAANETSLVLALRPDLVELSQLSPEAIPIGIWGIDPRTHATAERGQAIIEKNVRLAGEKLKGIVSVVGCPKRSLVYTRVASLLR